MRTEPLPEPLEEIATRNRIEAGDVIALRAAIYADGIVSAEQAEWLFALDEACTTKAPEWSVLFVEALVDFLVHQEQPHGYVSDANAAWMVERIAKGGVVKTATQLELLVRVLEEARSTPANLAAFALAQVHAAVVDGAGPLASGGTLTPGVMGEADVNLVRRILFAFGGDGSIAVTRQEAGVLFDINDATSEVDNHPSWSDLFVKAVANYLMAARGYTIPTRQEALRREAWLDGATPGVGHAMAGVLSTFLQDGLRRVWAAYENESGEETQTVDPLASGAGEVRWLAERIGRDGAIHENELALIGFLREESGEVDPALTTLLDTAA